MNSLRLFPRTIWEVLLMLPVAGLVLGYAFGGERGKAVRDVLFRPRRPGGKSADNRESHPLTKTDLRDLAREMRALQRDISELRARQERTPQQEIAAQLPQERPTLILERYMTESPPSENLSSAHGSQTGEIPSPPYALSDGGGRRYDG